MLLVSNRPNHAKEIDKHYMFYSLITEIMKAKDKTRVKIKQTTGKCQKIGENREKRKRGAVQSNYIYVPIQFHANFATQSCIC